MTARKSTWIESPADRTDRQAVRRRALLIAESDGACGPDSDAGPWHRLAIYRRDAPREYLVSIQSYAHRSKEPVRVARRFPSAVQAAFFVITCDPLAPLDNANPARSPSHDLHSAYDVHLARLLIDLDKAEPIYRRPGRSRR